MSESPVPSLKSESPIATPRAAVDPPTVHAVAHTDLSPVIVKSWDAKMRVNDNGDDPYTSRADSGTHDRVGSRAAQTGPEPGEATIVLVSSPFQSSPLFILSVSRALLCFAVLVPCASFRILVLVDMAGAVRREVRDSSRMLQPFRSYGPLGVHPLPLPFFSLDSLPLLFRRMEKDYLVEIHLELVSFGPQWSLTTNRTSGDCVMMLLGTCRASLLSGRGLFDNNIEHLFFPRRETFFTLVVEILISMAFGWFSSHDFIERISIPEVLLHKRLISSQLNGLPLSFVNDANGALARHNIFTRHFSKVRPLETSDGSLVLR